MGMQIKKFQAPTLQKALEMVREELGDGAIILQADPVRSGILGRNGVEVTAAIDRKDVAPKFAITLPEDETERKKSVRTSKWANWKQLFKKENTADAPALKADVLPKSAEKQKLTDQVRKAAEQAAAQYTSGAAGAGVSHSPASTMGQLYAMKTFVEPLQKQMEEMKKQMAQPKTDRVPTTALLESELHTIKSTLQNFIQEQKFKDSDQPALIKRLIHFWKEKGMNDRQIYSFLQKLEKQGIQLDSGTSKQFLEPLVSGQMREGRTTENPKQKIVCLVGATGVGKTTTIAKMAAFEKLKLGRSVALLTLDDYKIGGTDQLSHYARILEVPFIKLRSDLSLEEQIKHVNVDTIFVDTYGISPKDEAKFTQLRRALQFKDPALANRREIHLVMPVGLSANDVDLHVEAFSKIGPQYLLFTKWDETDNWGGMLATMLTYSIPVSFVGHGQEVPDDLSVFSSREFARTVTDFEQ